MDIAASTEQLVESSPDGVVVTDQSGTIRLISRQAEAMFGYARSELIGQPVEVLVPVQARAAHPSHRAGYSAAPTTRPMGAGCDLRAVRKDGSEFPVDIALSAMETADGPLFYAAVRDITHSRLAAIVEASDDAIIGKLLDGTVTSWNAGAQKLYGYTAAEMVGTNISRLVPADLPDELPDILRRVGRGERVAHFMTRRTRKDGSSVDVSITVSPISDSRGALLGATTVARDITDRERAVQAAARLGAIVDSSDDAIIGWGPDGKVASWNGGAERLFGYDAAEMIGQYGSRLVAAEHPEQLAAHRRRIADGSRVVHYESIGKRKDGTALRLSCTASPIYGPGGHLLGTSVVARDIAERKRIEAELAQQSERLVRSNRELHSLTDHLTAAVARAEASETRYRVLLDHLPDTITAVYDRDHRVTVASGPTTMDDLVFGSSHVDLINGLVERAFAGQPVDDEVYLDASGSTNLVHATVLPDRDGGQTGEVMVVVRDISVVQHREQALALSEARWRASFDRAPVALAEIGPDGVVVQANQAMADLLEVTVADLAGTSLPAHRHRDPGGAAGLGPVTPAGGGDAEAVVRHLVTARGHDRWVTSGGSIVERKDGQPERTLVYMVDVTAEAVNRQRLAEANARFASLVEHSADAIVVLDAVGGIVQYASPGFFAITGTTPASAVGSGLWSLLHPDDTAKVKSVVARGVAHPGKVNNFECRLRNIDGRWRHVEVTSANHSDDPAVAGIVVNLRDVTDRVEAAADLAHQAMHDTLTGLPNLRMGGTIAPPPPFRPGRRPGRPRPWPGPRVRRPERSGSGRPGRRG